jgi:hypothetical protein
MAIVSKGFPSTARALPDAGRREKEVPGYAIADGIYNLLYPDKTVLEGIIPNRLDDFQLCFDFG